MEGIRQGNRCTEARRVQKECREGTFCIRECVGKIGRLFGSCGAALGDGVEANEISETMTKQEDVLILRVIRNETIIV